MTRNHRSSDEAGNSHINEPHDHDTPDAAGVSRRNFLKGAAAGMVAGAAHQVAAQDSGADNALLDRLERSKADGSRRILLKNGIVLSLDPAVGDFERADVLIEGKKIVAVGPDLEAAAEVVDCHGMIVMPGFIDTHHHQYETIARQIIADGPLFGSWPQESYFSVVIDLWTTGQIPGLFDGGGQTPGSIFDLGRSPYEPEDCYIAELVASLSQMSAGVTTGVDTSQSSHTPEHTDAMIAGLNDSGRRTVYSYWIGRTDSPGYEYPGAIGDSTRGLGRLRAQYFSSDDQLVTLALHASFDASLFRLARSFGAPIVLHGSPTPGSVAALGDVRLLGPDVEYIHCNNLAETTWQLIADTGGKVSLATAIEMEMGHGVPAVQEALDHGILPSLSVDVETDMTADMFSVMRAAYTLQRMLIFSRRRNGETNVPPLLTCYQAIKMATIAGARCAHLDGKVGTLTPGKEADIIMLSTNAINIFPLNNAPGAVVTMMDTSNVRHVMIAGQFKKWKGGLVGVDVGKLQRQITASRDRVLGRIQSAFPAYQPTLLGSCCVSDVYNAR